MRILGVDPGLRITGYGVISVPEHFTHDEDMVLVEAGVVVSDRLRQVPGGADATSHLQQCVDSDQHRKDRECQRRSRTEGCGKRGTLGSKRDSTSNSYRARAG